MYKFFAYLSRLRYIGRWGLMRNTHRENVQEHSHQVCVVAHALCTLQNLRYGGNLDVGLAMQLAVFHDAGEVLTGDLVTPIKYHNPELRDAYAKLERMAEERLLGMLPADMQGAYRPLLTASLHDAPEWGIVKAADTLCAYIKCLEEQKAGNGEFDRAAASIRTKVESLQHLPCVAAFAEEFLPAYALTLDELN